MKLPAPYLIVILLFFSLLTACSKEERAQQPAMEKVAAPAQTPEQKLAELEQKAYAGDKQAALDVFSIYRYQANPKFEQISKWRIELAKNLTWLEEKAKQGDKRAQFALGYLLMSGEDIPKNLARSFEWFEKSCNQGDAAAQFMVGWMYENGEGIVKDTGKAVEWYFKSANQGFVGGQYHLATMYDKGESVPKDIAKAAELYLQAAKNGHPISQYNIAEMYAAGEGVPQDLVHAYFWANLAAASGDMTYSIFAKGARTRLEARMTLAQITEAQRMSREWTPSTSLPKSQVGSVQPQQNGNGKSTKQATGSGFFVSDKGHLLTNNHVAGDCKEVHIAGQDKPLKLITTDTANDLALLIAPMSGNSMVALRKDLSLRQGEEIAVYGYPLLGALSSGGNLSPGVVSALTGLGNNTNQIQVTAPIQQGNSGGPVLDRKGFVVGVISQKLNTLKVAQVTGDIPQNVNFAVNLATTRAFLDANRVPYKTGSWFDREKSLADIAENARQYTVVVECWK